MSVLLVTLGAFVKRRLTTARVTLVRMESVLTKALDSIAFAGRVIGGNYATN